MIQRKKILKEGAQTQRGSYLQNSTIMSSTFHKTGMQSKFGAKTKMSTNHGRTFTNSSKYLTVDSKNMTSTGVFGKTAGSMLVKDITQRASNWARNDAYQTQRVPNQGIVKIEDIKYP